uniref:Uncharacterized protein n=1 Tax=Rhizophora mucronata TaxID=61149 RepID=A0A2P2QUL0_RHIMU
MRICVAVGSNEAAMQLLDRADGDWIPGNPLQFLGRCSGDEKAREFH